jgi:hypothetical protein
MLLRGCNVEEREDNKFIVNLGPRGIEGITENSLKKELKENRILVETTEESIIKVSEIRGCATATYSCACTGINSYKDIPVGVFIVVGSKVK